MYFLFNDLYYYQLISVFSKQKIFIWILFSSFLGSLNISFFASFLFLFLRNVFKLKCFFIKLSTFKFLFLKFFSISLFAFLFFGIVYYIDIDSSRWINKKYYPNDEDIHNCSNLYSVVKEIANAQVNFNKLEQNFNFLKINNRLVLENVENISTDRYKNLKNLRDVFLDLMKKGKIKKNDRIYFSNLFSYNTSQNYFIITGAGFSFVLFFSSFFFITVN